MKNKRLIQSEHREEVKLSNLNRIRKPELPAKHTLLIVTEGANTEPSYFNRFQAISNKIITVEGKGYDPLRLVKFAIEERKNKAYQEVWCVFDRDQHLHFSSAIQLAKKNNIPVAYSNQAFEYWLLLHFEDHQGGCIARNDYSTKLNSYLKPLGVKYPKNKILSQGFFELLFALDPKTKKPRHQLAIERGKKIKEYHNDTSTAEAESSTTVYQLVELLLLV